MFMDEILSALSWWQMPLSGIGSNFLEFIASVMVFTLVFGLFAYIVDRL